MLKGHANMATTLLVCAGIILGQAAAIEAEADDTSVMQYILAPVKPKTELKLHPQSKRPQTIKVFGNVEVNEETLRLIYLIGFFSIVLVVLLLCLCVYFIKERNV